MEIIKEQSLKIFNTFGIDAKSKYFVTIRSTSELEELIRMPEHKESKKFILGGGSNVLFKEYFDGLIINIEIKGIKVKGASINEVIIEAGAGENWHNFVTMCVKNGFYGLENLAYIPGKVGAAPVQNIGAYGVEQKKFFYSLTGYNIEKGMFQVFSNEDCQFGYRNSIFKKSLRDSFIITSVFYRLSKKPEVNLSYRELANEISLRKIEKPGPEDVFQAVVDLRKKKLPEPEALGNAGSFFKNPVIKTEKYEALKISYPNISAFPNGDNSVKISAAWLIEKCGWKGKSIKNAGVYPHHSLILVNNGSANSEEILYLASQIEESVKKEFDIELEKEVLVV